MSIKKIQTEALLEYYVRTLYSRGEKPTFNEILGFLQKFFSKHTAGYPFVGPTLSISKDVVSNVDDLNKNFAYIDVDLKILYEELLDQVENIYQISLSFESLFSNLKLRRKKLATLIDDYLMSQYNTLGYYMSITDDFTDLSLVDMSLTTALVDTANGTVSIPHIRSLSTVVKAAEIGVPTYDFSINGSSVSYTTTVDGTINNVVTQEIAPFSDAFDGMRNTFWGVQVSVKAPSEVVLNAAINMRGFELTKIEIDPHTITPIQFWTSADGDVWDGSVKTSVNQVFFTDDPRPVGQLTIHMRKTVPDYTEEVNGQIRYIYVFGARELVFSRNYYDVSATFISAPLNPPFVSGQIIDSVSLMVEQNLPINSTATYYLAENNPRARSISDFSWKPIKPWNEAEKSVVHFGGATSHINYISDSSDADLTIIPMDLSNPDALKRNPNVVIAPGKEVFRLCKLNLEPLLNSMRLIEGYNSVRIHSTRLDPAAIINLDYWKDKRNDPVYSRIDTGTGFFYGADVGESARSIYVETSVEIADDTLTLIDDIYKADPNSRSWDIKVFVNGREVSYMPVGVNTAKVVWNFRKGLNSVVMLINIPAATNDIPTPYIGSVELMVNNKLHRVGTVGLRTLSYIDISHFRWTDDLKANVFTIYNGEIVLLSNLVSYYRFDYSVDTGQGPGAIRLRADLERLNSFPYNTPNIDSYSLKFSYGALKSKQEVIGG